MAGAKHPGYLELPTHADLAGARVEDLIERVVTEHGGRVRRRLATGSAG